MSVTVESIAKKIVKETFTAYPSHGLMDCEVTLDNGWKEIGKAFVAPGFPFDEAQGRVVARASAISHIKRHVEYMERAAIHASVTRLLSGPAIDTDAK